MNTKCLTLNHVLRTWMGTSFGKHLIVTLNTWHVFVCPMIHRTLPNKSEGSFSLPPLLWFCSEKQKTKRKTSFQTSCQNCLYDGLWGLWICTEMGALGPVFISPCASFPWHHLSPESHFVKRGGQFSSTIVISILKEERERERHRLTHKARRQLSCHENLASSAQLLLPEMCLS